MKGAENIDPPSKASPLAYTLKVVTPVELPVPKAYTNYFLICSSIIICIIVRQLQLDLNAYTLTLVYALRFI